MATQTGPNTIMRHSTEASHITTRGVNVPSPLMIYLLGVPYAVLPDGERVQFQIDNTLLLMAYLSMNSEKILRRAELASLFYPDHEEKRANQNVRQVIHRLRKLLRDDTRKVPGLLVDATTIRINPDGPLATDVSALKVQSRISQASIQKHAHRRLEICRTCMQQLEILAAFYSGEFLEGYFPHTNGELDDWVSDIRNEFRSKLVWVLHWLAKFHFEHMNFDRCEAFLARILLNEPLDEAALRMYMKILSISGHRNRALVRFHEFQRKLQADLNIAPEEETSTLAQALRTGGDTLEGHPDPLQIIDPFTHQGIDGVLMPDATIPFFGREREIRETLDLLESRDERIIIVKGVIGSGKTRFALHATGLEKGCWADHIYLIAFYKGMSNQTTLISALINSLNIPIMNSLDQRQNLVNFLQNKETLILIDNLDEIPDQTELIQYLVGRCPKIKFIITSRKHLGIRGEKVVFFNGLNYPALDTWANEIDELDLEAYINRYSALQLFKEIARRARADFVIDSTNISHVIQICEMLLGLPLGIELAASYVRLFTCEEIRDGVHGCLTGVEGVHNFIAERHGIFKKRFEYVWESLTPEEQELVKIVHQYPNGVVTDELLAAGLTTIECLVSLQDKSTLMRLTGSMVKLHPLVRFFTG